MMGGLINCSHPNVWTQSRKMPEIVGNLSFVSQKGSDGKIFDEMIAVKGNFLGSAEIDKFFRPFYTGDKAKNPFFNISIKHVDIKKMLSS